eukprot:4517183-Pleurochrysis_carterae.AAC.5
MELIKNENTPFGLNAADVLKSAARARPTIVLALVGYLVLPVPVRPDVARPSAPHGTAAAALVAVHPTRASRFACV